MIANPLILITAIYSYCCSGRNKSIVVPLDCQVLELKNGKNVIMPRYSNINDAYVKVFSTDSPLMEDITSSQDFQDLRYREIPLVFTNSNSNVSMSSFRPKDYGLVRAYIYIEYPDLTNKCILFTENEWVTLDILEQHKETQGTAESCD